MPTQNEQKLCATKRIKILKKKEDQIIYRSTW